MKLDTNDLRRLRQTALHAELRQLQAQLAQHRLRELMLRLEARYGLLGTQASIDIHTGDIARESVPARGQILSTKSQALNNI